MSDSNDDSGLDVKSVNNVPDLSLPPPDSKSELYKVLKSVLLLLIIMNNIF